MGYTIIDNPDRYLMAISTLRSRLRLEIKGIGFRGGSILKIVHYWTGRKFTRKAQALAFVDAEFDRLMALREEAKSQNNS